jgi:hypothetical protein
MLRCGYGSSANSAIYFLCQRDVSAAVRNPFARCTVIADGLGGSAACPSGSASISPAPKSAPASSAGTIARLVTLGRDGRSKAEIVIRGLLRNFGLKVDAVGAIKFDHRIR